MELTACLQDLASCAFSSLLGAWCRCPRHGVWRSYPVACHDSSVLFHLSCSLFLVRGAAFGLTGWSLANLAMYASSNVLLPWGQDADLPPHNHHANLLYLISSIAEQ
jgi:hypothetical protein